MAGGQAQQFARFLGGQMTFLMPIERIKKTPHVRLAQNKVLAHARSPEQITNNADNSRATNRGQLTRPLHSMKHELTRQYVMFHNRAVE